MDGWTLAGFPSTYLCDNNGLPWELTSLMLKEEPCVFGCGGFFFFLLPHLEALIKNSAVITATPPSLVTLWPFLHHVSDQLTLFRASDASDHIWAGCLKHVDAEMTLFLLRPCLRCLVIAQTGSSHARWMHRFITPLQFYPHYGLSAI